jgi:hypothetical protein
MLNKNIFSVLDSDDEDVPKTITPPSSKDTKVTTARAAENKKSNTKSSNPRNGGKAGGRGNKNHNGYDRKSGTGHSRRENIKQGGGAHNWGNEKNANDLAAEASVTADKATDEDVVEVEEEEENQMSFDEYMAKKNEERRGNDLFSAPNVRTVSNEFSANAVISKDGKTEDFMQCTYDKVHRDRSSGRKKTTFNDVGFTAPQAYSSSRNDRPSSFGGRSTGRGSSNNGGRGNNGRGRGNGSRDHHSRNKGPRVPNVSDMASFPSL